jgi:hypothetical protein
VRIGFVEVVSQGILVVEIVAFGFGFEGKSVGRTPRKDCERFPQPLQGEARDVGSVHSPVIVGSIERGGAIQTAPDHTLTEQQLVQRERLREVCKYPRKRAKDNPNCSLTRTPIHLPEWRTRRGGLRERERPRR